MAKRDRTEEALDRLSLLKNSTDDGAVIHEIRAFISDRSNLVIAKAAKIARERGLGQLIPDLVSTFNKLMKDPARLDKRCAAVTEISSALYEMDYCEPEVYLAGIKHVQMEASFGPPIDVAAALRGICAQGLVKTRDPRALEQILVLLVDKEVPARLGAVKALATNGGEAGALVLRLKVLVGDPDPEVVAECFSGLLASHRENGLEFVASYVDSDDLSLAEAAILALGASRSLQAIVALKEKWHRTVPGPLRNTILLALATSRHEEALTFLLALINDTSVETASAVLAALAVHKSSERTRELVSEAVNRRGEAELLKKFRVEFSR